jgi:L-threonylcarbamoyladenylate synthase
VEGAGGGLAIRWTADPIAAALVIAARVPLTSTSANRKGRRPATTGEEAARDLGGLVDLVLEAGPRVSGSPSTILDLTTAVPEIAREGAISRDRIEACLRRVKIHGRTGGRRA